ncbi:ARC6/PARC6 family protein [Synechococcus sp. Cruz-9H2]|uniref:ARC6/PARC6 family protein n=1 Tax=unclassified Synechococcus TaxID=2626047 RepID=UPI0020CDA217|nr:MULTISPECIES: ARC6/PARC6 family protein [unclassified Synechococcus]MCP9819863.1 ARC6/PARC6 family protein [Synechococcus sp. Cruz-9H2]MCP9844071.1 ARC6/PARC6 family protein [Synechococcus sp. Edmonson 11F2]MCP9856293.1 ARC6/PARC6 family protein [Synechococcus sp. Cruz-9C9]MCP9863578.1 ARC6/PARC6 family protein [Synechococcus sp. Cruz-7E5]MCP9870774.1 ARC6/PARC6 family protein [Synechococcus sp. Cruz-7B9]
MKESSRGFTNQQALLVLLICFPVGLIALGVVVILLQRPTPRMAQSQQTPSQEQLSDRSTTIKPLPSAKPPAGQQSDQQSDVQSDVESGQQSGLNQLEARAIVEQWLTVKSQIFAPPFNADLADQVVAAGPLWTDITKTDGSIQWLKNNNSYYSYTTIKVNEVISFLPSPSMPSIVVSVTEASILHSPNGNKASSNTNNWLYTLREEGGRWKIWDYRKQ